MLNVTFRPRTLLLLIGFTAGLPVALQAQTSTITTMSIATATATTAQQVVLTATVTPPAPGFVQFNYNLPGQPAATVYGLLSNGGTAVAVTTLGPIAAGTYSVQAVYPGFDSTFDQGYLPSSSNPEPLTIVAADGSAQSAFAGQYAFHFQGFSMTNQPYVSAGIGSFTADGHGNITAGVMDLVTPAELYTQTPLTGSYSLANSGQGVLTLRSPGLLSQAMTLTTTTSQAVTTVRSATATPTNAGLFGNVRLVRQTPISAMPTAQYVVQMNGVFGPTSQGDPPTLFDMNGSLTLYGTQGTSALLQETLGSNVMAVTYPTDLGNSSLDPVTGRFNMPLLNGFATVGSSSCSYSLWLEAYAIDASHLFLINTIKSCSAVEILSGMAEQ